MPNLTDIAAYSILSMTCDQNQGNALITAIFNPITPRSQNQDVNDASGCGENASESDGCCCIPYTPSLNL